VGIVPKCLADPASGTDVYWATWQASISRHTPEFFPEILGITMQFEWFAGPDLTTTIKLLDYFGVNSHFYTMHKGEMTCAQQPQHGYRSGDSRQEASPTSTPTQGT
jgi:hypothetical protein